MSPTALSSPGALWWGKVLRLQKRLLGPSRGNRNTGPAGQSANDYLGG